MRCRVSNLRNSFAVRIGLLAVGTAASLAMTGCSGLQPTGTTLASSTGAGSISGRLYGGNQPVVGATVQLYAAGTGGYGSAATLFATTTTGGNSYFSFTKNATNTGVVNSAGATYGCPASGDPQMYIMAKGGNTQGAGNGANSAAGSLVALGKCSTVSNSTFVYLDEVVTVATMAALQQYFNPTTESFGYPSTTQGALGFANALTAIPNMVNVATGASLATSTLTATPASGAAGVTNTAAVVTVTPEQAKINTIANTTAACVNTTSNTSTPCSQLFGAAVPPVAANTSQPGLTLSAATDVLMATYYMLTNPTSESTLGTSNATNMQTLYNLGSAQAPFQPALTMAPTDWTIGIRYSSASTCATTLQTATGATANVFLAAPFDLAVDATGNVWVASGGTATTSSDLIELTPNGTPATCALGSAVALTKGLTIDPAGNVWIASNTAASPFYKYSISSGNYSTLATATASVPYAVAADGSGNIFYTDATNKAVNEFVAGATSSPAQTNVATVNSYPYFMAIDTTGNLLVPNSTITNLLYLVQPSTATGNVNGYVTTTLTAVANVVNPYAVAAGLNGAFYLGNSTSASSTVAQTSYTLTPSGVGTATFGTNTAQYVGGLAAPRGPNAIDGAGNVWIANSYAPTGNYASTTGTATGYSIAELTAANVAISATGQTGGFQKDTTIISTAPRALAIDPSGNVWGGSNSATGNGVFEIVGAAVPVVTPISGSLQKSIAASSNNAVSKP